MREIVMESTLLIMDNHGKSWKNHFLSIKFTLSVFCELLKSTVTYQLFSRCMMFGMHFDNISVPLNFVADAYVHFGTLSVTITC